ncbi:MAG: DUF898 family protein [Polyangiales bacterium]
MHGPAVVSPFARSVRFGTTAGFLVVSYLLWKWLPAAARWVINLVYEVSAGLNAPRGSAAPPAPAWTHLLTVVQLALGVIYTHALLRFEWDGLEIDGRRVRYVGSLGQYVAALFVPTLITVCTLGFGMPWFLAKYNAYAAEHCEIDGARLSFHGNGGDLFGRWLLGSVLTCCTLGIYSAWLYSDVWAWTWENTEVGGRRFSFRRDPAGLLGEFFVVSLLTVCTAGIYWPWAAARLRAWEVEHVQ